MLKLKLQYFGYLMQRANSLKKKILMLGKIEGQEEKRMAEDKHYQFNGHSSEQTLRGSEGQGSQTCCRSWEHKELDTT